MDRAKIEEIEQAIQHKTVDYNESMAKAERIEEQIKILRQRLSNLKGEPVWDTFELDISETVKTVELPRHNDRAGW